MSRGDSGLGASVFGRDAELALLDDFVVQAGPGIAIVLIGDAGFGKTTLWQATVESARGRLVRTLTARPSESGAQSPFGGLIDLCDGLEDGELAALPGPQRRALEVALMRAEPADEPAPMAVVAVGLLGVVRALAASAPVLIAIDDLQWLDPPSIDALMFVVRRLDGARVAFLLARRPGRVGPLEGVLARARLERLQVGSLSLGAVRGLLFERLGLTLSRQRLRRIVEATDGNPLFALEVGRALLEGGGASLWGDLPLPDSLVEVLGDRVAGFPAPVRSALLAVALSEDARVDQLVALVGAGAFDDAVDAGAVVLDGGRVRASHPLLAAAAEKRSLARERRELHLALSAVTGDEPGERCTWRSPPSAPTARWRRAWMRRQSEARSRGARRQAACSLTQALRLTQDQAPEHAERVLALAGRLDDAGELRRMTELLREELGSLPAGPLRARAWLHLSESEDVGSREDQDRYLDQALNECGKDREPACAGAREEGRPRGGGWGSAAG